MDAGNYTWGSSTWTVQALNHWAISLFLRTLYLNDLRWFYNITINKKIITVSWELKFLNLDPKHTSEQPLSSIIAPKSTLWSVWWICVVFQFPPSVSALWRVLKRYPQLERPSDPWYWVWPSGHYKPGLLCWKEHRFLWSMTCGIVALTVSILTSIGTVLD